MAFRFVLAAAVAAVASSAAPPSYHSTTYAPPAYGPTHAPSYSPAPTYESYQYQYQPQPSYGHQPAYGHQQPVYGHQQPAYGHQPAYPACPHYPEDPACSKNSTDPWCLEDSEYPEYEIQHAISYNKHKVLELYADVADLNTENSVERLTEIEEETYLCPSEVGYVRPLRAVNTDGKWRVIVNNIKVDYETFTQTTRIEKCLSAGEACPLVPQCYESSCLQKSVYHRFLVYDPCDQYFPFAIETFQLPASCACSLGAYEISH
ncbi:neurotrophin 1-like [Amphibalanus amphitrite]|uniref:neurotrophin 1-like n=1 Tax=Amphibalanus amphitrite TaxID=1232801 RepID=UPI001C9235F4|nr:neurotrophin 1-like [Amphibalanus amphitrite]